MMPMAQAIGELNLTLLELVPRRGISLEIGERVYIGDGKRDKIYYILGRLPREKLTESAKSSLHEFIKKVVKEREVKFLEFFNKSEAINKRMHQIELLPGLGKKHMQEILKQRKEKPFESFDDMKKEFKTYPIQKGQLKKNNQRVNICGKTQLICKLKNGKTNITTRNEGASSKARDIRVHG